MQAKLLAHAFVPVECEDCEWVASIINIGEYSMKINGWEFLGDDKLFI